MIHRDLKPSNIIYDKYADKVTLIDFGTSKIKTVMDSETTMPLYSEGYSAPELILGKNITEKCDYYSIGIIMSEILLSQKNEDDITSNIEEWTGRKEIKDILLSLVQEKPENRPDSLENVMVVLEQLIGNLNTSSCSYSIAIDSRKLVQLKRNSIVEESMTMVQFTNSFLKNEFKQAYGYYDVKDQQYIITGEKMILKCGYDENEQKMYVTYVGKISADRRNINIKRSFRIVGQMSFVLNSRDNGYDPQDNHKLVVMFKNHQDDNKQYQLQEEKFENLFGGWEIGLTEAVEKEKGKVEGILAAVYQSAFGKDAYPSLEEKAANLLYFMIKDHPYADGCKRIAASLFLEFLVRNNVLYEKGQKRISDGALVAITLMIAESDPKEKDIMVNLVMNLLTM